MNSTLDLFFLLSDIGSTNPLMTADLLLANSYTDISVFNEVLTPEVFNSVKIDFIMQLFTNNSSDITSSDINARLGSTSVVDPLVEGTFSTEKAFPDLPSDFNYLDIEVRRRHKKYPHLTVQEVYDRMISPGSDGIEMALRLADEEDSIPINYSNLFTHNGEVIDVTKLSHKEVINLATTCEDIAQFEALEHIRSTYICSAPNVKLYYPEPFIASPSFTHNDIGFIHILQYQF